MGGDISRCLRGQAVHEQGPKNGGRSRGENGETACENDGLRGYGDECG